MKPKHKILVAAGVVVLLGVMAVRAVQGGGADAVEVRAEVVSPRSLVSRVTATGHIEPKRSVEISADISGRVVQLPVEEGQDVEEGDLLLVIDPTQYEASVRQARARLAEARAGEARARADYLQAGREWDRLEQLQDRTPDLITTQEVEQSRTRSEVAEAEWEAARHAVDQAEAAVEEAQDRLDKTVIRAPMSGRITRLNVDQGETAIVGTMNNPGTVLLAVADLGVMEAVIEVDETDVPQILSGDSASLEIDAFPDTTFAGRVTKIGNSSMRPRNQASSGQDQAVDFEVRITLADPPAGIRPDLSTTADIITATREDVLAIPIIALTLENVSDLEEGWRERLPEGVPGDREEVEGVFVVDGGTARFQPVRVGVAGDSYFEVLAGLSADDTVVSGSYQAIRDLRDGDPLDVTSTTAGPADRPGPESGPAEGEGAGAGDGPGDGSGEGAGEEGGGDDGG